MLEEEERSRGLFVSGRGRREEVGGWSWRGMRAEEKDRMEGKG